MDKEKLIAAGIDYDNALRRFAGKEALYEKYLVKFKDDNHLELALAAKDSENYEEMLKAIHTMKGVVGTLGMTALFQACAGVVNAIRAKELENMDELVENVKKEYAKMIAIL